jgi:multidrug efflux pump subunit AcrB
MNFRNLSAWSIRHPVVPIVIFTALILMGIISFARMEVQNSPDIEFPIVIVSVTQPGAAPTEIETQITQRVEAAVRSISGVHRSVRPHRKAAAPRRWSSSWARTSTPPLPR